ncbi:MAG: Ppx/GppA family phosphatase [Prevotella sp.]
MRKEINPDSFNLAAIDIGTNAARLLIKSVTRHDDGTLQFQKIQFVRFPLRLGMDVFMGGKISKEREAQLVRMTKAFRHLMLLYDVADYRACATSALRDAKNGPKILKGIKKDVGIDIDIISGKEEARTIIDTHIEKILSLSAGNGEEQTTYLYVDVGGGSTEVSYIAGGELKASESFNIGTLRMLSGTANMASLNDVCSKIKSMTGETKDCVIIGSGGNINKLYRLVPKKTKLKDRITTPQLRKLHDTLAAMTVERRISELDLKPDRADVIVPAAKIFLAIADALDVKCIAVPTIGLSDGIINELANKITNRQTSK